MSHSSSSQSVKTLAETSSALVMEEVSGSHRFQITRYSRVAKLVGRENYIESAVFYVGGHAWTIRYYPNSSHLYADTYDRYVGFFVELASDATDVRALYKLEILDQNGRTISNGSTDPVTFDSRGRCHGNPYFVKMASLILKDDCLTVRCTVTVFSEPRAVESKIPSTAPPSDLHFCDRLKAACLKFIASPGKLIAVAVTDGFDHLKKSCPSVLKELQEKFGFLPVKEA